MARRVVGYEGDGRARRPVYVDEGPASARIGGQVGEGRSALLSGMPARELASHQPAGRIERRQVTAIERDIARVARPALGSPEHVQASRMRGAARHVEVITARRPVPAPSPEEPTMAIEAASPPVSPVDELVGASHALQAALDKVEGTSEQLREAEEHRVRASMAHQEAEEALTAAYARLDAAFAALKRRSSTPGFREAEQRLKRLTTGEAAADPEPVGLPGLTAAESRRVAAGGGPGAGHGGRPQLGRKERQLLELVVALKGDRRTAATRLNLSMTALGASLHRIGSKGLLPAELIPLLPAGFAKYTPADL